MSNRPLRRFPRLRRRVQMIVDGQVRGYTVDLSAGGAKVENLRPLPLHSTVVGSLVEGDNRFTFTGKVLWVTAGVPTSNVKSRSGVQFSSIDPTFYTWLLQLIDVEAKAKAAKAAGSETPGTSTAPGTPARPPTRGS
jgi:hypothetical protein